MRMPRLIALILTITFASAWPLNGQQAASYEPPEARVLRLDNGALLTGPSNAAARVIVARVLRERGVPESTLASLALVSESRNERTGIRDVRFEQRVAGLSVYDAYVRAALTADGAVVQIIDATVPVARGLAGDLRANAQQALRAALQRNHPDFAGAPVARVQNGNTTVFAGGPFFHADPTVTRVAIPLTDGSLRQGYLVETWSEERNQLNHTLVEGDGAVLAVESRTSQDSYNVFTIDPEKTPQTVVAGPGSTTESPEGWLSSGRQRALQISGNNVSSYLDTDANNEADAGGQTITNGDFITAAELTETPSTNTNKAVATQNLFYLNNVIHDRLYTHGFTEAAGNFQEKNFGRGGRDSDSVNAEAQDGSGTDNANFATPPDGKNPRMQMFLWAGRPSHFVEVTAPFSATFDASGAQFGPALDFDGITGEVALVNDGTAPTSNACEALAAGSLSGKIALIDRGTCTFLVKVKNAQNAGAIAAIVANNQGNTTIVMGGIDPTITIPSVFVGQDSGAALRSVPGVTANLRKADVISRDSSLDSDIVYHEYGHGLTWRMIGRMSGPLSGAIGEGMSDTLAIIINDNDRIGEYSFSLAAGIRSAPYTNYPRTYKNVAGTGVHFDGEVYGAIGWRLWQLFQAEFPTKEDARNQLLDYLVQGMTFTPAGPMYEDMRDGILTAVRLTNPGHECLVWRAFAKYGVGVGASGRVMGSRVLISESTQVPAGCPAP